MTTTYNRANSIPSQVVVRFPGKRCSGVASDTVPLYYAPSFGPSDVGLTLDTSPGYQVFHDACPALYNVGGGSPTNQAALDALAKQIATDFYKYQSVSYDLNYVGVLNFAPNAIEDETIVKYTIKDVSTRYVTKPLNGLPEELLHHDPANSACTSTADPCQFFYGPPWSCDGSGHLVVTRYKLCLVDGRNVGRYVSTDTIT